MLVQLYMKRISDELGRAVCDVPQEVLERLRNYSWPGNIRELQSVLKRALLQTVGTVLLPASLSDLPQDVAGDKASAMPARSRPVIKLSELERDAIQQGLNQTGGNRQLTAELLGISTRTLLRKIREYGLSDPLRPPPPGPVDTPTPPSQ
jgi:two-component system nitrogen regulation response regulator GlnG